MLPLAVFVLIGVFTQQTFADEPEAIVGGTPASLGEFPWQCSLNLNGRHFCGGSIIANNKILTAAHCVHGSVRAPYNNFRILCGTIDPTRGQFYAVQNVREHPNYKDGAAYSWENDIAVITLKTPIQFNQYQSPIALADSVPAPGTLTILSGWGLTSAKGPPAQTLLKMHQNVVSQTQCRQSHYGATLTNSHLCAYNRRGIGACMGDSGGPLVANGKQVGVVSWSQPCAVGVPDVYTNVYHHLYFIQSS